MLDIDGITLAEQLEQKGYTIKEKTKSSLVVLVAGDRNSVMLRLAASGRTVKREVKNTSR